MDISKRAKNIQASPIRKLAAIANKTKERGIQVYHLNIGQPDISTPSVFYQNIRDFPNKVLSYGPSDGLEDLKNILVIAATNRPDMLDTALLRPGRFDKILLVNAPEEQGRKKILQIHTRNMPLGDGKKIFDDEKREKFLESFAKITVGYTGADLHSLSREAAMLALRESTDAEYVTKKHFEEALKKIKPSVTKSSIDTYKKIEENYLKSAKSALPLENSYLG